MGFSARFNEMNNDEAEKVKVRRALRILYLVMTVFIAGPLVMAFLRHCSSS